MDQNRGILFLADPLRADSAAQRKSEYTNLMTLIFDENGRYLSLAQAMLWKLRQKYNWICVAAEGQASCIAVALAAQLPVDRLVLMGSTLFLPRQRGRPRELARLEGYARRNLSLVVSEIMLLNCGEAEVKGFLRGCIRRKICVLDVKECRGLFTLPWEEASRNNLLIPTKCV